MPWFFVDDAFADSKPVMQLDRALRNEATGLWVRCGAWSAKEETDGRVPLDVVRGFGGTPRLIRALHEQAELWVESSPESWRDSREILFGKWEKWQKTRAENQAKRKADASRQAVHRRTKKGRGYVSDDQLTIDDAETSRRDSQRDIHPGGEADSKDVSRRESQCPDPTRPDPTRSFPLVTSSGGVTKADANNPRPQCNDHPNDNHDGPCPGCKRRRKWDEAHAEELAADELRDKRLRKQLQENCTRCHGTNTYEDAAGVHKCYPHQEASHA